MPATILSQDGNLREKMLKAQLLGYFNLWMEETGPVSDASQIVSHPAYKRIVGMGREGIPIILRQLEREPSLLAWALFDITGIVPVTSSDYGNLERITQGWLKWGRKNKYI